MQKIPHIEVNEICNQLGEGTPKSIKKVLGGDIHKSWQIEFNNAKFFLKRNKRKEKLLKFEEYCLRNLRKNTNEEEIIIPKVISYLNVEDVELLLMEWIDMHNYDQKKLGKGLGEMHLRSNETNPGKFGYPIKGYIGITEQVKGWENDWINCFIKLRIQPQLIQKQFII